MCAIFGSTNYNNFTKLYELNKPRGISASSAIVVTGGNWMQLIKSDGAFDVKRLSRGSYYLGHCQAPTTLNQQYNYDTAHPFSWNRFLVAHNGIITNAEELAEEYKLQYYNTVRVDSSVIPGLIGTFFHKESSRPLQDIIKQTAELLKGTFACYIFDDRSSRIFLIRSGSTLFYDKDGNFSSTKFDHAIPFEEGRVGELVNGKVVYHNTFICNSPFFI